MYSWGSCFVGVFNVTFDVSCVLCLSIKYIVVHLKWGLLVSYVESLVSFYVCFKSHLCFELFAQSLDILNTVAECILCQLGVINLLAVGVMAKCC